MNDVFEDAIVKELTEVTEVLLARRQVLSTFINTPGNMVPQEVMGRMFALGAMESSVRRLVRRARGEGE